MSSVCIFIKPANDHDDPRQDWKKFKCGDVIDMHKRDKFNYGSAVHGPRALGLWAVVVLPDVPVSDVAYLMDSGPMPHTSLTPQSPAEEKHQRRLWAVDVAKLKPRMTAAEFNAAVFKKRDMINPAVIG